MSINTIFASIKARAPLLLAITVALLFVRAAAAHASLVRSDPAAGTMLEQSPPSLRLEFSEDLDLAFSQAQLFDSRNQLIEPGPGTIDSAAPRVLRLILPDLPKGSYTALWRVRSAADGHVTQGNLPFGVGVAPAGTALIPPPGTPDPATLPPPLLDTFARWLNFVAAALALGGLPFAVFVWRPALRAVGDRRTKDEGRRTKDEGARKEDGEAAQARTEALQAQTEASHARTEAVPGGTVDTHASADVALTRFIRRTTALGGVLFVLTNLFFLLTQAAAAANVSLAQAIGLPPYVGIPPVLQLLSGRSGLLWLARLALTLQIVVLTRRLPSAGHGPAQLWWALLAVGGVVVLTLSLLSHAAASSAVMIAVPLDWLHLVAMLAWLGGLVPLAFAISMRTATPNPDEALGAPHQGVPLALIMPYFSRLTSVCVAILIVTGIYNYTLQIGALDLLAATTYGRALLIKLGLFGVLLLLGGLNLFVLTPRLRLPTKDEGRQTMDERRRTKDDGRRTMRRRLSSIAFGQKADRIPENQAVKPSLVRAFGRSVRAELIAGALLLLLVGTMTSVAPSKTAWEAHEQQGIAQSATIGAVGLTLRIAPAQIGDNEFAVDVADARPGAAAAPTRVLLRFEMQGMDMGKLETPAQPTGAERYTARGSFTSMGGRWHVEVLLRRASFDDVRHTFEVDIVRGAPFVISQ
jgi:copper transport protein